MKDTTERKAGSLDIGAYRINQSYGETLGSKKLISHVAVGKPVKGRFFQASADSDNKVEVYIYEDKLDSTFHLVSPAVSDILGGLVRAVTLHLAIDRANNPFLIPVPFPAESGQRNPWHQSLLNAIQIAHQHWVRIESDKSAGVYQVYEAQGDLQPPIWPTLTMDELVGIAFSGRVIDGVNHPKVQSALGRV